MYNLIQGDCLQEMDKLIANGVKVDMVLTDPPYGTTACKWDSVIPFEPMWAQLKRIIKGNGAIVLFGSEPFSSALRMSNIKQYKYDWIWLKSRPTDFVNANNKPMKKHENVSVFSCGTTANGSQNKMAYNPQGVHETSRKVKRSSRGYQGERPNQTDNYLSTKTNYPTTQLLFASEGGTVHPTQKPVALLEYLIRTYTNEGETVLDFTMGSGSTGVACLNTNRNFIGIELDQKYYNIAKSRLEEVR